MAKDRPTVGLVGGRITTVTQLRFAIDDILLRLYPGQLDKDLTWSVASKMLMRFASTVEKVWGEETSASEEPSAVEAEVACAFERVLKRKDNSSVAECLKELAAKDVLVVDKFVLEEAARRLEKKC